MQPANQDRFDMLVRRLNTAWLAVMLLFFVLAFVGRMLQERQKQAESERWRADFEKAQDQLWSKPKVK